MGFHALAGQRYDDHAGNHGRRGCGRVRAAVCSPPAMGTGEPLIPRDGTDVHACPRRVKPEGRNVFGTVTAETDHVIRVSLEGGRSLARGTVGSALIIDPSRTS